MYYINGKEYESIRDFTEGVKSDFRKRYKKNVAVCEKPAKQHEGIYGAVLWSGGSGLPWFLSFDLEEVLNYVISNTNWKTHPDLARVEFIKFGEFPRQKTVGYLYSDNERDGYLTL